MDLNVDVSSSSRITEQKTPQQEDQVPHSEEDKQTEPKVLSVATYDFSQLTTGEQSTSNIPDSSHDRTQLVNSAPSFDASPKIMLNKKRSASVMGLEKVESSDQLVHTRSLLTVTREIWRPTSHTLPLYRQMLSDRGRPSSISDMHSTLNLRSKIQYGIKRIHVFFSLIRSDTRWCTIHCSVEKITAISWV